MTVKQFTLLQLQWKELEDTEDKWAVYLRYCCRRACAMTFSRSSRGRSGATTPATLNLAAPFPIQASISFSGVSFSFSPSACFKILTRSRQCWVTFFFSNAARTDVICDWDPQVRAGSQLWSNGLSLHYYTCLFFNVLRIKTWVFKALSPNSVPKSHIEIVVM